MSNLEHNCSVKQYCLSKSTKNIFTLDFCQILYQTQLGILIHNSLFMIRIPTSGQIFLLQIFLGELEKICRKTLRRGILVNSARGIYLDSAFTRRIETRAQRGDAKTKSLHLEDNRQGVNEKLIGKNKSLLIPSMSYHI